MASGPPSTASPVEGLAFSAALRALEPWRAARRVPVAICLDAALVAVALSAGSGSLRSSLIATAAAVCAGLLSGWWRRRASPETQGVAWLARPVALAHLGAFGALVATSVPLSRAAPACLLSLLAVLLPRAALWPAVGASRRRGAALAPALVVGPEEWVRKLRHRMRTYPEAGLGFAGGLTPGRCGDERNIARFAEALERLDCRHVVLAEVDPSLVRRVAALGAGRFDCSVVVSTSGLGLAQGTGHIGDIGLLGLRLRPEWGSMAAKRLLDLALASLALLAASPLLICVAAAIRLADGGPAIFRQRRVGRGGRTFDCYKLRSMVVDAEQRREDYLEGNISTGLLFKLEGDPRITPIGRLIRRFSIDELPQLVNVLKGEMSLVGPRPLPVDPEDFDAGARTRHLVPPGITGPWQVQGANALGYSDMLGLDLAYVATRSMWVDLVLIIRTIPALLVRRSAF